MNLAIEVIQDRIIYLTGQIVLIELDNSNSATVVQTIEKWKKEIEQLREAQKILEQNTIQS